MFCYKCGNQIPNDSKICLRCGSAIPYTITDDNPEQNGIVSDAKPNNEYIPNPINNQQQKPANHQQYPVYNPAYYGAYQQPVYPAKNIPIAQPTKNKKNLERFIGTNVLPKIGAILLLLGTIAFGKFAFKYIPNPVKLIILLLVGIGITSFGALMHKKRGTKLSTGIMAGGIAVLFASVVIGHIGLSVLSPTIAFIMLVVIAGFSVAASVITKEELICIMGTIGGYIPIAAMINAPTSGSVNILCAYFTIFAAATYFCNYKQQWIISKWISLACHLVATCMMNVFIVDVKESALPIAIFTTVSFIIYIAIPLTNIFSKKISSDGLVFLSYITCKYTILLNFAFRSLFDTGDLPWQSRNIITQIICLVMALIHIYCLFFNRKNEKSKILEYISSIFSSIFLLLIPVFYNGSIFSENNFIPFIFLTITGILIMGIGYFAKLPVYEIVGAIGLLPVVFLENYQIMLIAAIGLWLNIIIRIRFNQSGTLFDLFKLYGVIYSCFAIFRIESTLLEKLLLNSLGCTNVFSFEIIYLSILIISGILILPKLRTRITEFSFACFGFSTILLTPMILSVRIISNDWPKLHIAEWILMFVISGLSALILYYSTYLVQKEKNRGFSISLSCTSIAITLQFILVRQTELHFDSIIISVIYGILAVIIFAIGLRDKNKKMRLTGLILSLLVAAKLCFLDTRDFNHAYKFIAYFAFAFLFFGIAMIYSKSVYKFSDKSDTDDNDNITDGKQSPFAEYVQSLNNNDGNVSPE